MKLHTQTRSLLILAVLGLFLSNCGGGGNETPAAKVELGKLKGEWSLSSATLDGVEKVVAVAPIPPANVDKFFNVTLEISGTYSSSANATYDYAISGTTPEVSPWPKPGDTDNKWSFASADQGLIVRDPDSVDEIGMTYSIANNQLTISFTLDGSSGWVGGKTSKAAEVNGAWIFVFDAQ